MPDCEPGIVPEAPEVEDGGMPGCAPDVSGLAGGGMPDCVPDVPELGCGGMPECGPDCVSSLPLPEGAPDCKAGDAPVPLPMLYWDCSPARESVCTPPAPGLDCACASTAEETRPSAINNVVVVFMSEISRVK
jgi:hypothetical protein